MSQPEKGKRTPPSHLSSPGKLEMSVPKNPKPNTPPANSGNAMDTTPADEHPRMITDHPHIMETPTENHLTIHQSFEHLFSRTASPQESTALAIFIRQLVATEEGFSRQQIEFLRNRFEEWFVLSFDQVSTQFRLYHTALNTFLTDQQTRTQTDIQRFATTLTTERNERESALNTEWMNTKSLMASWESVFPDIQRKIEEHSSALTQTIDQVKTWDLKEEKLITNLTSVTEEVRILKTRTEAALATVEDDHQGFKSGINCHMQSLTERFKSIERAQQNLQESTTQELIRLKDAMERHPEWKQSIHDDICSSILKNKEMSTVAGVILLCNTPLSIKSTHHYLRVSLRPLTKRSKGSLFMAHQYGPGKNRFTFGKLKSRPICKLDKTFCNK